MRRTDMISISALEKLLQLFQSKPTAARPKPKPAPTRLQNRTQEIANMGPEAKRQLAGETLDKLIQQRMETDGSAYPDAFLQVAKERPKLHALWGGR